MNSKKNKEIKKSVIPINSEVNSDEPTTVCAPEFPGGCIEVEKE